MANSRSLGYVDKCMVAAMAAMNSSYMSENVQLNHVSVMYLCIHVRMHSTISKCLFFLHNDM